MNAKLFSIGFVICFWSGGLGLCAEGISHASKPSREERRPLPTSSPIEKLTPPPDAKVASLIRRLSADTFSERQSAMTELEKLGDGLLNSKLFVAAKSHADVETRSRVDSLFKKLIKPYEPMAPVELLRCLATLANKSALTKEKWRIASWLSAWVTKEGDPFAGIGLGGSASDIERNNATFDNYVKKLRELLEKHGLTPVKERSYLKRNDDELGEVSEEKEAISFEVRNATGDVFVIVFERSEISIREISKRDPLEDMKSSVSIDENRCLPDKKLALKQLLPGGVRAGVLQDSEYSTVVSVPLKGGKPNMSFTFHSRKDRRNKATVPCCGAKIDELVDYLFEPDSKESKELKAWPHVLELAIPQEYFWRSEDF